MTTPLLSVRRAPVFLQAPVADGALVSGLDKRVTAAVADRHLCRRPRGQPHHLHEERTQVSDAGVEPQAVDRGRGARRARHRDPAADQRRERRRAQRGRRRRLVVVGRRGRPAVVDDAYIDRFAERYGYRPQFTDIGALAARIAAAGVTEIRGDVIGDDRRYDRERTVPSWPTRFVAQGQVGPISALAVNDGFTVVPPRSRSDDAKRRRPRIPRNTRRRCSLQELRARNVRVTGVARGGAAPAAATEITNIDSPTMRQIVAELLTLSDNNTAEALTKEMGLKARNEPTTVAGVATIRAALQQRQLPLDGVSFADGSGLDPNDKLTCAARHRHPDHGRPDVGHRRQPADRGHRPARCTIATPRRRCWASCGPRRAASST